MGPQRLVAPPASRPLSSSASEPPTPQEPALCLTPGRAGPRQRLAPPVRGAALCKFHQPGLRRPDRPELVFLGVPQSTERPLRFQGSLTSLPDRRLLEKPRPRRNRPLLFWIRTITASLLDARYSVDWGGVGRHDGRAKYVLRTCRSCREEGHAQGETEHR